MTIYLTDSVVVLTVSQGEIVSLQFDKSHPILQEKGNDMKLNDTKIKISTRLEIKTLAFYNKRSSSAMKHRYLECIHDPLQIKPQISYG